MPEFIVKCTVCRALLDEEDLFCVNCGTEAPTCADNTPRSTFLSKHNFSCENCGASMSYDASVQNLRCPFCGSEKLHAEQDAKILLPEAVLPMQVTREGALASLSKFMGNSFWRPADLAKAAAVTKIAAIYVPYWVFSASVQTYWTADSSQVPPGARASWFPVSGQHSADYQGVLVGASGTLTPAETHALCPFDLSEAVFARDFDLDAVMYEPFRVQKKYARPQAIAGFEALEREACRTFVPGSARNLHVALRLDGLSGRPVLLPVWILAYQYRGQTYRFIVNGQTGRNTGEAPFSYFKLILVIVMVILAVMFLIAMIGICSGLASR
jgi:predicted RNA-binding Zn-ribbon protein involved in translation (DUF1610 family)